jgi:hypothetical protein
MRTARFSFKVFRDQRVFGEILGQGSFILYKIWTKIGQTLDKNELRSDKVFYFKKLGQTSSATMRSDPFSNCLFAPKSHVPTI